MNENRYFMEYALKCAKTAFKSSEVPVGAIIVSGGKIIARGHNRRLKCGFITEHAELNAIKKANRKKNDWRLDDCTMYVTLYPCPMCASAITQSRIKKLVIGAPTKDLKNKEIVDLIFKNSNIEIVEDILKNECSNLLIDFFKKQREK